MGGFVRDFFKKLYSHYKRDEAINNCYEHCKTDKFFLKLSSNDVTYSGFLSDPR